MQEGTARAFAPAVISNFFVIHDEALHTSPIDMRLVGATGGGFTLSKGVYTTASVAKSPSPVLSVKVNGDARFRATTTKKAVELLVDAMEESHLRVELEQDVQVPIGAGFGSSSASALSAVMAVASALGLGLNKEQVASFAHDADILSQTGLGTVSSTYDHVGAGIITRAGGPGVAEVRRLKVPRGFRVVTATLSTMKGKEGLLSSQKLKRKVNELGQLALERAMADASFEGLLTAGQTFAEKLGLETPAVKRLIAASMKTGAVFSSQNMIGDAIHSIVREDDEEELVRSLISISGSARVDVFGIGGKSARVIN